MSSVSINARRRQSALAELAIRRYHCTAVSVSDRHAPERRQQATNVQGGERRPHPDDCPAKAAAPGRSARAGRSDSESAARGRRSSRPAHGPALAPLAPRSTLQRTYLLRSSRATFALSGPTKVFQYMTVDVKRSAVVQATPAGIARLRSPNATSSTSISTKSAPDARCSRRRRKSPSRSCVRGR